MIKVQIAREFKELKVNLTGIKELVKTVCSHFNLTEATVGIVIVDDTAMTALNRDFLAKDSTTDCLSFHLPDDNCNCPPVFEIVVNAEMALRQAKLRGHKPQAELALYITHSLLHNLGFDDSTPALAKKMHETEDKILQQLGYGLVYYSN